MHYTSHQVVKSSNNVEIVEKSYLSLLVQDNPIVNKFTDTVYKKIECKPTISKQKGDDLELLYQDTDNGGIAIKYNGETPKDFSYSCSFNTTASELWVTMGYKFFKNNTPNGVSIDRYSSSNSDVGALSLIGDLTLEKGDIIEFRGVTLGKNSSCTIKNISFRLQEI